MPHDISDIPTRRKFLLQFLATTSATALASSAAFARSGARPFTGGFANSQALENPPIPPTGGDVLLSSFQVSNSVAAASLGMIRVGLPIKPNDCQPGRTLEIRRSGGSVVPAQFDKRASWKANPSEGVQYCTACIRDTDFAASETRTYFLYAKTGSFNNTSSRTLSTSLSGSDYKVDFTSIVGDQTGSRSDLTASLNTHAAVPTRVTKNESGPICDSYSIWGMARSSGGIEDAHLKTVAHFSQWKDANGNRVADELCFVSQLDWWARPNKEGMVYTATLKNGASTIQAYTGVDHPYQAHWATVRMQNDDQHARRHWVGAARPTLVYKPDSAYWRATGVAPPYDTTVSLPAAGVPNTYTPCSAQGHRTDINGTGGFLGEGLWSTPDVLAFNTKSAADVRRAICAGFAGLHITFHYHSEKTRTRPGESADIANTTIPLIMWDERGEAGTPTSYYTFTADGMPAPAHAYANTFSGGQGKSDGWVRPFGVPQSGDTFWTIGYDQFDTPSHAVIYSDFCYIYTGEQYYLDASIDLAMASVVQVPWYDGAGDPPITFYDSNPAGPKALYPGAPATRWAAIAGYAPGAGVTRVAAWALKMVTSLSVVPDNDVQANYLQAFLGNTCRYMERSHALIPAAGNGAWSMASGSHGAFMCYYMVMAFYYGYARTRRAPLKAAAEYLAKFPIQWAQYNRVGQASIYHTAPYPSANMQFAAYNSVTNDFFQTGWFTTIEGASVTASTDNITMFCGLFYTAGDKIMSYDANLSTSTVVPTEMPLGQTFYMVNPFNNPNGGIVTQVSATPGGAPINFTSDYSNVVFIAQLSGSSVRGGQIAGAYGPYARAAFMMARFYGHPDATSAQGALYDAWYPVGSANNGTNFTMITN